MKTVCILTAVNKVQIPFVKTWVEHYSGIFPARDTYMMMTQEVWSETIEMDSLSKITIFPIRNMIRKKNISNTIEELLGEYDVVVYTKPSEYLLCEDSIIKAAQSFDAKAVAAAVLAPVHLDSEITDPQYPTLLQRQYCVRKKPRVAFTRMPLADIKPSEICYTPTNILVDVEFIDKRFIPSSVLRLYDNRELEIFPSEIKDRLSFIKTNQFDFGRAMNA